jgi:hypothetical protein
LRVSAASSCALIRTHHSRKVWTFACKHERQSQRKTDKAHTGKEKHSQDRYKRHHILIYVGGNTHSDVRMNVV